jgi:hypothetical protein
VLERHNSAARDLLSSYPRGEEIKTTGDGFLLVFTRPSEAVKYSLALQQRLRALSEETRIPLRVRIGIHVGEVFVEYVNGDHSGKDLLGLQVDITQRVMDLGMGGQILMTRSVYDNGRSMLDEAALREFRELRWCNHGSYMLKGVDEPCEVCEVGEALHAPLAPPEGSAKAVRVAPVLADRHRTLGEEREQVLERSTSEFMLTLFGFRVFSFRMEQSRTGGLLGGDDGGDAYLRPLPLQPYCTVLMDSPVSFSWDAPAGSTDASVVISRVVAGGGELDVLCDADVGAVTEVVADTLGVQFEPGALYAWEVSYLHDGEWGFCNGLFEIARVNVRSRFEDRRADLSADNRVDALSALLLDCGLLLEFGCLDEAVQRILLLLHTDREVVCRMPLLSLLRETYLAMHRRFVSARFEDGAESVLARLAGLERDLGRLSEQVVDTGVVVE